ncbi:hypothetical protein GQ55_3G459900 [Panicum hallii var. hallii]|uniref:Uncharacterized protein n=1 Tax=Panicum hallii var. hallii TaxID=1504633 RepID=A0A2T7EIU4_9POAL|nr:hypothetical protein GQ55_3G459900 [Panicum hallii var. hallii]
MVIQNYILFSYERFSVLFACFNLPGRASSLPRLRLPPPACGTSCPQPVAFTPTTRGSLHDALPPITALPSSPCRRRSAQPNCHRPPSVLPHPQVDPLATTADSSPSDAGVRVGPSRLTLFPRIDSRARRGAARLTTGRLRAWACAAAGESARRRCRAAGHCAPPSDRDPPRLRPCACRVARRHHRLAAAGIRHRRFAEQGSGLQRLGFGIFG